MGNGFAGAQDAGVRRRRRLSQDEHDEQLFDEFFPDELGHDSVSVPFSDAFPNSARLLRRFVSPRLWKHVCVLTAVFAVVLTIAWWDRSGSSELPGIERNGLLISAATGLLFLFGGQLAFVIGWVRSQSSLDFRGRYRWWKWFAIAAGCAGLAMLTGTHLLIPDAIATTIEPITGPIQAARPAVVLVPGLLFCVIVLGCVIPDMGRSVWSQGMLVTALLVMTVRLMLIHTASRAVVDQATLSQMLLCSAGLVFSAMLLHCRFVAFINNDPPVAAEQASQQTLQLQSKADASAALRVAENSAGTQVEAAVADNTKPPTRKNQPAKNKAERRGGRKAA